VTGVQTCALPIWQINGTTGYEEAAAQGLVAGINAACRALERDGWTPGREESYMGVMIDDLITRGTSEPYRMFTSRAEYRLLLREDNADLRLTETGRKLGLVDDERWGWFEAKREAIARLQAGLSSRWLKANSPEAEAANAFLAAPMIRDATLMELLRRPEVAVGDLAAFYEPLAGEDSEQVREQIEIQAKYAGYIERQQDEIERTRRYEHWRLPEHFDYGNVTGLSTEVRERLRQQRPETLGQAGRIPGVTPAAISLLLVHLKKKSA
jgi:tRNA uridine 5-carboxymethylaminomethyl modification enzyme